MDKEEYIKRNKDDIERRKLEDRARLMKHWENLKHFNNPDDVPDIPVVDKDEYEEFYLPKLFKAGAIRKIDLNDGQVYIGNHRRCTVAKWNEASNVFEYWRNKFGQWFIDTCNHFEDDNGFALFVPIKHGTKEDFKEPEH